MERYDLGNTSYFEFIDLGSRDVPVEFSRRAQVGAQVSRTSFGVLFSVQRICQIYKYGHPPSESTYLPSFSILYEMATEKPTIQNIEMTTPDDAIRAIGAADPVIEGDVEEDLKQPPPLPKAEDQLDALGIPNWRQLEKQVVRRLDFTLMPCLWCLYLFNYLDRASIGQARISTLQEDINLSDSQFSTAVSILSYGLVHYILMTLVELIVVTSWAKSLPT